MGTEWLMDRLDALLAQHRAAVQQQRLMLELLREQRLAAARQGQRTSRVVGELLARAEGSGYPPTRRAS